MGEFEDNLWREVESTYGAELSDAPDPLHRRSRLRMPVLAGTGLGVLGGGVAAVIVLSAASSSPAFAVTRHADGTVSVVIRRIEGIAGANRRLQLLGIRARAVRVSGFCSAAPPPALAHVSATVRGRSVDWVGGPPAGWRRESTRPRFPPVARSSSRRCRAGRWYDSCTAAPSAAGCPRVCRRSFSSGQVLQRPTGGS